MNEGSFQNNTPSNDVAHNIALLTSASNVEGSIPIMSVYPYYFVLL